MDTIPLNWTTLLAIAVYVTVNPPVRAAVVWIGSMIGPAAARIPVRRLATPLMIAIVVAGLLADSPAAAQMRRGGRTSTGGTKAAGSDPALAGLVASFEGTLREVSKKGFTVELTNGNSVEFRTTKKTEYYDEAGKKQIQMKDLFLEAFVKVEGVKDGFGYITANKVILPAAPAADTGAAPKQ
jgi:energy-coupling factor transporter transmembrane protein EcfT